MKDIKKSENEVTVLGFNAAGWGTLEKVEKKRLGVLDPNVSNPEESGSKVYGFGATPVPDEKSIYHRCHIGKEMSEQKKEIIERFALTVLVASIEHLPSIADFVPDASVVEALENGLRITSDDVPAPEV